MEKVTGSAFGRVAQDHGLRRRRQIQDLFTLQNLLTNHHSLIMLNDVSVLKTLGSVIIKRRELEREASAELEKGRG